MQWQIIDNDYFFCQWCINKVRIGNNTQENFTLKTTIAMSKDNKSTSKIKTTQEKGEPSSGGQSKAQIKDAKNVDGKEEIEDKYTDGPDDPSANVRVMNPNRNTDKTDSPGPSYS
jgi:hypothetical protein